MIRKRTGRAGFLAAVVTMVAMLFSACGDGGGSGVSGGTGGGGGTGTQMGGAIQGTPLSLAGGVNTLAGAPTSYGSADGAGAAARFSYPREIATDGTNLFVADSNNHTIRKVVIATGVVTTLAGAAGSPGSTDNTGAAARFSSPWGIATDNTNLFVADRNNNTIRKVVIATGVVTTLAGTAGSSGSTDNTGATARFYNPSGLTTDGTNLFVADTYNQTIRKVVIATGEVTTIAGTAGYTGSTDNTGAAARFFYPYGITNDGTNLFVADSNNSTIRKVVIATGEVTTIAGTAGSYGSADGTGEAARFSFPYGITNDGTNLFVADSNNQTIRKVVIATGEVTTIAGTAGSYGYADGTGTAARFSQPTGITTDGTNLFVADTSTQTIRKVVIDTGVVTTIAGTAGSPGYVDGTGTATRFSNPYGITTDGTNLFVTDQNRAIRKIAITTGVVTTIAGGFQAPYGLTTDGTNLFVADGSLLTISKVVIATGVVTTIAGGFQSPYGLTTDGTNLFVADMNNTIRKVVIATGVVTTLAGTAGSAGFTDNTGAAARFNSPRGITTDGTSLFVADSNNNTIRKVVIATGVVTTIAGTAGSSGSADDTGAAARFYSPWGITTDGTSLFVADSNNQTIRVID
jgi:hypothetical protein